MNILITGGSGFIGKNFIPRLLKDNHNVTLLVRDKTKAKKIFGNKVKYIVGDVMDASTLVNCCKNVDIVYHLVAKSGNQLPTRKNLEIFDQINVQGTKNIVNEAKKAGIQKFIYISSTAAMGIVEKNPINEKSKCSPYLPYEVSKYKAERMLLEEYRNNNFPVMILRPTKVYGGGARDKICAMQLKLCKRGINLIIGGGQNMFSNVHVSDFCGAMLNCIKYGMGGEIYIISGPDSISAKRVGEIMGKSMNKKIINIRLPKTLTRSVVFLEERFFIIMKKKPIVTARNIEAMSHDRIYDLTKAEKWLHYQPKVSMEEGIKEEIAGQM